LKLGPIVKKDRKPTFLPKTDLQLEFLVIFVCHFFNPRNPEATDADVPITSQQPIIP